LARLYHRLSEVEDIEITSRLFGQVQLHRNNQFYDFLLKVCELIHLNLLISEKSGASKFTDFVRDRAQMAALFEAFVRNFFKIEEQHHPYQVKRDYIEWKWQAADAFSSGLLPRMETDISLTSRNRRIIIDCKYTPEATQQHFDAEKLRSSHLYQINAYMNNLEGELADTCEMMLLYPATDRYFPAVRFKHQGRTISIRTINLNQPWPRFMTTCWRL
jgi:5-methylcytosine-specific restriction enzyme subunit McrC